LASVQGVWEFFLDIGEFFRTVILSWWAGFLLPIGLIAAIILGGWWYFFPFLAANGLVAYKFNKARKAERPEMYDDKSFTNSRKSLDEYIELVKKSKSETED
jgi:hypothetical protein